jgi:hypothetical protein
LRNIAQVAAVDDVTIGFLIWLLLAIIKRVASVCEPRTCKA